MHYKHACETVFCLNSRPISGKAVAASAATLVLIQSIPVFCRAKGAGSTLSPSKQDLIDGYVTRCRGGLRTVMVTGDYHHTAGMPI